MPYRAAASAVPVRGWTSVSPSTGGATGTASASTSPAGSADRVRVPRSVRTAGSAGTAVRGAAEARRVSVRDGRCETRANVSADDGSERLAELLGLGRVQLDHEAAATLQGNAHDDAASLLRDLERPVTRPRLHRGH